jgi:hypothetical protein
MRPTARVLTLLCFAAAAGSALAGTVNVSFVDSARFADAGATAADREATLRALSQHLQARGGRVLPADQVMTIDVLDVDLAGAVKPLHRRAGTELRIAKGMADWPSIKLRYSLESNGKVLKSGEESVADMDYMHRTNRYGDADPLHHEKQMLDDWFKTRFGHAD